MTQLIYVRNIQAAVQLRGKVKKKKSVVEESLCTLVPLSHSFKSCNGKLE